MKNRTTNIVVAVVLMCIAATWLLAINGVIDPLLTKIAILFSFVLAVWVWQTRKGSMGLEKPLILLALIACAVADGLLAFSFTLPGIGVFLAAHLLFFWAYRRRIPHGSTIRPFLLYLIPALILVIYLGSYTTGIMTIAVVAYGVVIALMAGQAATAWVKAPNQLRKLWGNSALGALLFFISDCLLGYKMFVTDFSFSNEIIIGLYWAALILAATSLRSSKS